MSYDPRHIIKEHLSTERTTRLKEAKGEYVFVVDKKATKYTIKDAVEKAFNVKVLEVRTLIMPGKTKRLGRYEGKSSTWKKAIVRLKKDQSIALFDNV